MTKTRFSILILAVLTALILAGCGASDDSQVESSVPEALQTFGVQVNPSAQPSTGQVIPQISAAVADTDETTTITGGNITITEQEPETTEAATQAPAPSTTKTPSSSSSTAKPSPSPSPSASPNIAPPAPASSATVDDVMQYVGKSLAQLIEDHGYPSSSSYEYVDEEDPSQGEIGTMYYADFTVTTLRNDDGETITAVVPKPQPSAETSAEPSEEVPEESPTTTE